MIKIDVVVTRHKGLVDLLIARGYIDSNTPIVAHATPEDIVGKNVLGVLPHWLSSLTNTVTEIPLNVPVEKRGQELEYPEIEEYAGEALTYVVRMV